MIGYVPFVGTVNVFGHLVPHTRKLGRTPKSSINQIIHWDGKPFGNTTAGSTIVQRVYEDSPEETF